MESLLESLLWNALEVTGLALVVLAFTGLLRPCAPFRHALWLLVLLKLVVSPWIPDPFGLRSRVQAAFQTSHKDASIEVPDAQRDDWDTESLVDAEQGTDPSPPEPAVFSTPPAPAAAVTPAAGSAPRAISATHLAAGAWLCGSLIWTFLIGAKIVVFARRVRRMPLAAHAVQEAARNASVELGMACAPEVRISALQISPLLWVLGRPVVVLPTGLLAEGREERLRGVLYHELAHLRRKDHWISWIEITAVSLYWWLPTTWLTRRLVRSTADECADAWAVDGLGSRREYAKLLLEVVETLSIRSAPGGSLGWQFGERRSLERRLVMIMKQPLSKQLSNASWVCVALLSALLLPSSLSLLEGQDAPRLDPPTGETSGAGAAPVATQPPQAASNRFTAPAPAPAPAAGGASYAGAAPLISTVDAGSEHDRLQALERQVLTILEELRRMRGPQLAGPRAQTGPAPGVLTVGGPSAGGGGGMVMVAPSGNKATLRGATKRVRNTVESGAGESAGAGGTDVFEVTVEEPIAGDFEFSPGPDTRPSRGKGAKLTSDQRRAIKELDSKFHEQIEKLNEERETALRALLTPEQFEDVEAQRVLGSGSAKIETYRAGGRAGWAGAAGGSARAAPAKKP